MRIVLSIKPEFVKEIQSGRKRFEFRKAIYKQQVEKIYIYASRPIGKIVGEFNPVYVIKGRPEDVWQLTKKYAGINKKRYDLYYNGKHTAYAIEIKNLLIYSKPKVLPFHAPQSFRYIEHL